MKRAVTWAIGAIRWWAAAFVAAAFVVAAFVVAAFVAVGCDGSPIPASRCGAGTHLDNGGICVVDTSCGAGTTLVGSVCFAVGADAGVTCGPGTRLVAGECVPQPGDAGATGAACGPGTMLASGLCVPSPVDAGAGIACGAGTHLVGSLCLPLPTDAGAPIACGSGTHLAGGTCLADPVDGAPQTSCGPGTYLAGDTCLPSPDAGGTTFIVRVGVTTVGADGFSSIPVVVIGTNADGSPSLNTVVLDTSRAGAGVVSPSTVTLGPTGATVYFTPCSSAASMWCPGPVHITLALASAPNTVVAESQEIDLVAPNGVGSDAPCLAGGDVLFFNGDAGDYVFSGTQTVTKGSWSASGSTSEVHISVTPSDPSQGLWWDLYFDSSMLSMPALATQVYENAERWPFEAPGHPGLDVSGDGRGCNTVTGRFQIEDLQLTAGSLVSFTATFEHHCEGGIDALRGCVHYSR